MTKRQRIETVLAGEVPDKTPISLWYHFGTQHEPGDIIAQLALEFFRYYLQWLLRFHHKMFQLKMQGS